MGNDQDRRALIAIVLSLGVYLLWSSFFAPPPVDAPIATDVAGDATPAADATAAPAAPVTPAAAGVPTVASAEAVPDHAEEMVREGWTGEVASSNGSLRGLTLNHYTAAVEAIPLWSWAIDKVSGDAEGGWEPYTGGTEPHSLLTSEGALVLAGAGAFDDDGAGVVGAAGAYRVSRSGDSIVARRVRADGLSITKTYSPGADPYTLDLEVRFDNGSSGTIADLWVGVADRMGGDAGRFLNSVRPLSYVDGSVERVEDLEDVEGNEVETFDGPVSWFGLGDRYFMAVLIPEDAATDLVVDALPGGRVGSFNVVSQPLDAGATRTVKYTAFMGPKELDTLKTLGNDLDEAVEFGWFGFFAKALLFLLKLFQTAVVNWGVAIIVLTITVKLVFFPLTQKSFVSSRKMQALQPQLKAMKEKFKDNRELQSQETMKLFKEHQVNPMGGCLPTLVQFPVWIALYNVMLYSVELYDTSFLYLQDLTAADPYGVLPTAYVLLMFGQQRMMPMSGMDENQQKIVKMMPLVFGFLMYSFPCGLVLYFSCNMLLTIAQQWLIKRRFKDVVPARG